MNAVSDQPREHPAVVESRADDIGAPNAANLLPQNAEKPADISVRRAFCFALVAGAGFEPAAFRL